LKVKEKSEIATFFIFANKGDRGWFFFPSLSEGKNHPLPICGDCNVSQFVRFVRGDEITSNDIESLSCPVGLARFLTAFGAKICDSKIVPKGLANNVFRTVINAYTTNGNIKCFTGWSE